MKKTRLAATVILGVMLMAVNALADYGDVNIHGFVSQGFLQSTRYDHYFAETEDGTFQFNEMGLNFSTKLTENLRLGMQFFAKDLGQFGNDEIMINWAFADYRPYNWLGVKVGKFKKPIALYNASRDVDPSRACIFLPFSIYNENNREPTLSTKGISVYGQLPLGLEYNVSYGPMDLPENGSVVSRTADLAGGEVNAVDVDASTVFFLFWSTPIEGLKIGGTTSDYDFVIDTPGIDVNPFGERYIVSLEYIYNDLLFAAEWMYAEDEYGITTDSGAEIFHLKRYAEGWYVMGSYRFTDWLECGGYYSIYFQDRRDQDGTAQKATLGGDESEYWLEDVTVFTRFDMNESWIAKFEVHSINGLMEIDYDKASNPNPRKDSVLFAAKMTYVF